MYKKTFLIILVILYHQAFSNSINVGFLLNRVNGLSTEPKFNMEQPKDIKVTWNKLYFGIEINKSIYTNNHDQIGFGFRIDYLPLSSIQKLSFSDVRSLDKKLSIYQFQPAIYFESDLNTIFKLKFGGSIIFNGYELKSNYLPTNLGFSTNTETNNLKKRTGCFYGEIKFKISNRLSIPIGIRYSLKKQDIKSLRAQKDINPVDPINDPNIYGFMKIDQIYPYLSICYQIL